eukprot:scaffold511521_cov34-Prasinocladus_malaysianus.AAC.1
MKPVCRRSTSSAQARHGPKLMAARHKLSQQRLEQACGRAGRTLIFSILYGICFSSSCSQIFWQYGHQAAWSLQERPENGWTKQTT